ncbi:hypothetical protein ABIC84_005243, partial [Mucilaginibacter sp. 3215]
AFSKLFLPIFLNVSLTYYTSGKKVYTSLENQH